jgi:hypothetical protein
MKNFTSIITAIAFAGIISFVSCSKDRIEPNEDLNSYESMDEYLDSKKQAEQEYEITEEGSEPLQGQQGTKIWIGKDLLMFPDSSDVEWPFTIRLVELYTPKDMIYYQMPSVAGQNMLETEGEIRVRAFKVDPNGVEQELLLKPGRVFAIEMPSDSIRNNLSVYYGYTNQSRPDWTTNVQSLGGNNASLLFTPTATGHSATIGKLGWINCGRPNTGQHTLSFTSETDELTNVKIFVYLPVYKGVVQSYNQSTCAMPDSSYVKVLAMAINSSDELFYTYAYTTLNNSATVPITLEAISDEQLTQLLDSL